MWALLLLHDLDSLARVYMNANLYACFSDERQKLSSTLEGLLVAPFLLHIIDVFLHSVDCNK